MTDRRASERRPDRRALLVLAAALAAGCGEDETRAAENEGLEGAVEETVTEIRARDSLEALRRGELAEVLNHQLDEIEDAIDRAEDPGLPLGEWRDTLRHARAELVRLQGLDDRGWTERRTEVIDVVRGLRNDVEEAGLERW